MHTSLRTRIPAGIACLVMSGAALAQAANADILTTKTAATGSKKYNEAVTAYLERKATKIIGGAATTIGKYPWQVSLGASWVADPYAAHFCGGSIYSPTVIVTAGHCVQNTQARDIIVSAGTAKLGHGGVRRNVRRVIVHADYRVNAWGDPDNDIALLELLEPLPLGPTIKTIPLMTPAQLTAWLNDARPLATVGWGATVQGGQKVRDLRYVKLGFVRDNTCSEATAYGARITGNMICAGNLKEGGTDACQGDSGGPLSTTLNGATAQVGVVSWGEGCGQVGLVGVYARVPNYATWVQQCAGDMQACR